MDTFIKFWGTIYPNAYAWSHPHCLFTRRILLLLYISINRVHPLCCESVRKVQVKCNAKVPCIVLPDTWSCSKLTDSCVTIRRAMQQTTNDAIDSRRWYEHVGTASEELPTACSGARSVMRVIDSCVERSRGVTKQPVRNKMPTSIENAKQMT